jgi:hypothetical protein
MQPRPPERDGSRPKREVERQIEEVAGRQLLLIDGRQLAEAGVGPRGAAHRVAAGSLHRMHQNVYALHPPPHTRNQRYLAATMTYGAGAALSHGPAGVVQEICDEASAFPIHVSSPRAHPRGRDGIICHPAAALDPRDIRRFDGVTCVSADLVLVQLAPTLDEAELEVILVAAESRGFLKRGRLIELVNQRRGRPGIHKLASLLALERHRAVGPRTRLPADLEAGGGAPA